MPTPCGALLLFSGVALAAGPGGSGADPGSRPPSALLPPQQESLLRTPPTFYAKDWRWRVPDDEPRDCYFGELEDGSRFQVCDSELECETGVTADGMPYKRCAPKARPRRPPD